jgi:hypothetical protein
MWRKGNPYTLLQDIGTAILENDVVLQKTKNTGEEDIGRVWLMGVMLFKFLCSIAG